MTEPPISNPSSPDSNWQPPGRSSICFVFSAIALGYVGFILLLVSGDIWFGSLNAGEMWRSLLSREIRYATALSLATSVLSAWLAIVFALPMAWLFSRYRFPGRRVLDSIIDIPILLPPLVVGISLLILFRQTFMVALDQRLGIAFHIPAIVIAQTTVVTAFAYRTLRGTFDGQSPRAEQVARSLGCSHWQAFWRIAIPNARHGIFAAATIAWARAIGQFGPILVFAGTTRGHTEVLPVSIYLELNRGNLHAAVGLSLLMIVISVVVLILVRTLAEPVSDDARRERGSV